ncbi:hypothetical protein LHU53_18740 [Rhodoferax sp. U2-2l]|uniref:hypothetical protein n=1 Tax=Rhodoferax sp. U2-2l TaxID=2884000 RepID=UPI001D0B4E3B|nr:hypothetical protein [Rhodoferax sp. U2-2l]MCB8748932.1 hypothetical protein [Rhodoferax sp. U2-2l]
MFITDQRNLSPVSALHCDPGQKSWLLCELALSRPWFLVTLLQSDPDDSDCVMKRTLFASSIEQVAAWAKQGANGQIKFDSALIVTPNTTNGTSTWQMEPLASIWSAEEPEGLPGYPVDVCQTQSGARYVTSIFGCPPEQLTNYKLRHQFSA